MFHSPDSKLSQKDNLMNFIIHLNLIFEREYPEVRFDLSLEVVDKTLVNMFEGL